MHKSLWYKAALNAVQSQNPHHQILPMAIFAYNRCDLPMTERYLAKIVSAGGPDNYLHPVTRALIALIIHH